MTWLVWPVLISVGICLLSLRCVRVLPLSGYVNVFKCCMSVAIQDVMVQAISRMDEHADSVDLKLQA